jgi:Arc/MetJ-type ribon-helix-helix transcriptional regulator
MNWLPKNLKKMKHIDIIYKRRTAMRRIILSITIIFFSVVLVAQTPQRMSYQAVVRNSDNKLITNQKIGMRISILQGSSNGQVVYSEKQSPATNENGLVSFEIGGGSVVSGDFSAIDWSKGPFFVKTETDPSADGGTSYSITGVSQLLSTPYALYAKTAEKLTGNLPEKDPKYLADSSFIKKGVRDWNSSLAKTIDATDTTRWGQSETDPVFKAWDKSNGITITESQITDLKHFTNSDETDPKFAAWNKSTGITIKESQVTDLHHFTNADEIDPVFGSSVAKGISSSDILRWNNKNCFSGNYSDLTNKPLNLSNFNNDIGYQLSVNDRDTSSTNELQYLWSDVNHKRVGLSPGGGWVYIPDVEGDPVFGAWNKSTGIRITESQITDLHHFTNANETDPRYAADSSFIKRGVRSWNSSLAKTIDSADTTYWGRAETDPFFSAWNKSTGIRITESQITNLKHFTNADEIDPRYASDSSYIKSGVRSWNSSFAKTIDPADTTRWGVETDPVFSAWDKSAGIAITESQITNLKHFTTADEIDPLYTADSSFIKTGTRSWNSSLAKTIDATDTTWWGRAETDPLFSAWNRSSGITITESQITDLDHFTTADEIDPRYAADSLFIKSGVQNWNSSLAKKITSADTTRWGNDDSPTNEIQSLALVGDSVFLSKGGGSIKLPAETDPVFTAWDKSTGIAITESQITDLDHFTTADEIDPLYAADSSFIKTGVRDWNSSLAKTIDSADTTRWGNDDSPTNEIQTLGIIGDSVFLSKGGGYAIVPAETDPVFTAWNRSSGITITESQISDLDHFTTADEIDPKYAVDSSFIKTGVRSWNSSVAKNITTADITDWNKIFDGNYSSLTNAPNIALSTSAKTIELNAGGTFSLYNGANTYLTVKQSTGLVGIGTNATDPRAQLEIGGTEGLLVRGTVNQGTIRALGAGLRMHWYPRKGAFRVGNAESQYWDDNGTATPKMALYSIGMGYQPRASAVASTAIGAYNQATGDYALSLGSYSQATSTHAVAIGTQAYATGIYSIAIGSGANTNGRDGSMIFGDDAYFQTAYSSADNQLTMRFIGGYRLWTSYPDSTAGVYMRHGANGWSSYCDRNLKTNFKKLDFEEVLKKVDKIPVTEWNYKGNDTMKYIGPMAQDFYAAFHLGGTDSLGINSISIDGVNMAAIKGLIQRTDELKSALDELKVQNENVGQIEGQLKEQDALINEIKNDIAVLKAEVSKSAIKNKEPVVKP